MDMYRPFTVCILGAMAMLGVRATDKCVQEVSQDYDECMQGMVPIIQALGSNPTAPNDASSSMGAIFEILCSPEGRVTMDCIMGIYKRCPAALGAGSGTGAVTVPGLNFTMIDQQGGMNVMCQMMQGNCKKVLPCIQAANQPQPPPAANVEMTEGGPEMSTNLITMLLGVCGSARESMLCIQQYAEECPDVVAKFEEQAKQMMNANPDGPKYEKLEHFMMHDCESMPTAFKNDPSCEARALSSAGYTECYVNVSNTYNVGTATKLSCNAYTDSQSCLETHVEPSCGEASTAFLKKASPLFIKGLPTESECNPTSGAAILQASATLVMLASVLILGRL